MKNGLVSVVMAVHNEKESFLWASIGSLLNQTYPDIEIIIVDDDSDEECKACLNAICQHLDYVHIVHNETNYGLTKSLNIGIEASSGEFIARMDADDFSVRNRLSKQVNYLKRHPEIDIVGSGVVSFGEKSVFMSPAYGYDNNEAQCMLFFSSTLCHPSVMMRRSFLDTYGLRYDESVKKGQDYDLWERASIHGRLAVMSDVLLYYRTHARQITSVSNQEQIHFADVVRLRRLNRIGIIPTEKEFKCHQLLGSGKDNSVSFAEICQWTKKLLSYNSNQNIVNGKQFGKHLRIRLFLCKVRNRRYWKYFSVLDVVNGLRLVLSRVAMFVKLSIHIINIKVYLCKYTK